MGSGSSENIFNSSAQVLVNPVNLVGVMGKGLALSFKNKYPEMFEEYKIMCRSGKLQDGILHLYKAKDKWILNFPTKHDWRNPSDLSLIEHGLQYFAEHYQEMGIQSIAFPKLGCGLGGLDWEKDVRPLMKQYLGALSDIVIDVCGDVFQEKQKPGLDEQMKGAKETQEKKVVAGSKQRDDEISL